MATDPWAAFNPQPAQGGAAPGPVYGPQPKAPAPPTPLQIRDQQLQEEEAARKRLEWNAERNPDGTKKPNTTDPKLQEAERTAAFLATRLFGASKQIGDVSGRNFSALRPGMFTEGVRNTLGDTPANYLTGSDRQVVEGAQIDLLDSALTLGTGAAYTKEQLEGYRRAYFPQLGDSEAAVKGKQERLKVLLEAAKLKAGNAAPQIDQAIASVFGAPEAADATNQTEATATPDGFGSLTGTITDEAPSPDGAPPEGGGDPYSLDTIALGLAQGAGSVVQGAGDTIGILANPIGQTLYNATGYGDQRFDAGTILREGVGLPANPNQTSDAMIRAGTGGLLFGGAARGLAGLISPGAAQSGLRVVGAQPLTDAAAGVAGGYGGEQARQAGYGPGVQTLAALALGAPVAAAGSIANRAPRVASPYAAAAERQGVQMMPADAGGPTTRRLTGGLAQSPVSAGPIVEAAQANQGQIAAATRRAADGEAATATTDIAGDNVRAAGERYSQQTSARGGRLYDRAEQAAQGVHIVPQNTIATIDAQIARLSENEGTNAALIGDLQTLRADLASGASVAGMRDLRTNLRGGTAPTGALRSNQQQQMYRGIVDQLSTDIEAGLSQAGRGSAAQAFRRADDFWRQRVEQIDQVLQPILGRDGQKSGEEIIQSIEGMARGQNGGNRRLGRLMANMAPDERSNVRATVIDRMGRATPGQQTAEGNAFSASTFLTNWSRMTPQAKATMFGAGELRRNLDDIALLAQGSRDAGRYANHSNTSGGNIVTGAAYLIGTGVGGLKAAATIAALQYSSARLLSSPRYARWLAQMPATQNPRALNAYAGRLGTIAAEDALIASDARGLQQRLQESLGQSPTRAAAEDKEQN